ncbi:MAG TPA: hypothetical protein VEP28_08070, partial [Rubrobacter sp.]|nr:hypothetical protein [Rubrobacter sp.]
MKEISKMGGPGTTRRHNDDTLRAVKLKRRRTAFARRRKTAGVALIACLLLIGTLTVYSLTGGDEISRGVSIGSVEVGGMTRDEAREAVQDDASTTYEQISFGTGKEVFSVNGDDLGIKVDAASAVDEAYSVGRRGNVFQHLSDASRSY